MERIEQLEARVKELEAQVAELKSILGAVKGAPEADQSMGRLDQLVERAPEALRQKLIPLLSRMEELLERGAREELITVKLPELVELCHHHRVKSDTGELFYSMAEEILAETLEHYELETIQPVKGEKFLPSKHRAVRVTRSQDPGLRDQIEMCIVPGFQWHDRLVKKAQVTVFL